MLAELFLFSVRVCFVSLVIVLVPTFPVLVFSLAPVCVFGVGVCVCGSSVRAFSFSVFPNLICVCVCVRPGVH